MNLQEEVMRLITSDWVTSKELAELIAEKNPEEFKKEPYLGDISNLSKALGPVLWALRNQGRIADDGTKYPGTKRWKRLESIDKISVGDAAKALVKLNLATDESQAIRMLASRTIRDHREEFERLVQDAFRVNEEALRIGRQMLGIKPE